MSRKKFKMTPFARFFLVMLIAAPLAYLGSAYYNGVDPIESIKELIRPKTEQMESVKEEKEETPVKEVTEPENNEEIPSKVLVNSQIAKLQDLLTFKTQKIDSLYLELEKYKLELAQKDSINQVLQEQLDKIRGAIEN